MNICFVIGTLSYSGAEKIMYHLIKKIYEKGYKVSLILLATDKKYDELKGIDQYIVYDIKEEKEGRVKRTFYRQKKIRNIINDNKFDVVISFGHLFNVDVAEACVFSKTKIILCERNDPVYDPKNRIKRLRRKISYQRGNGFVFQTETIKSFFSKKIQSRSTVIPNFIEEKIPLENRYSPERNVIATACRIDNYQKDLTTLIKAFSIFSESHKNYILELYGDGPDQQEIQNLCDKLGVSPKVRFCGKVDKPMRFIRKCKIFVLSSKYEGMPNSLIEAMAYGMPCIASNCSGGGAKSLIEDGVNGFLFNVGDVEKLVLLLERLCKDNNLGKNIGFNAAKINETLNIELILKQWINFILKIVNS